MKKVKVCDIVSFLIAFSMLLFAIRGKYGAILISVLAVVLLFYRRKGVESNYISIGYAVYLILFAVLLNTIRTLSFEYYLTIGYFVASLICLNCSIKNYGSLWKYLQFISILEAFGIYLQRALPQAYYLIISIILPSNVVSSIQNRLVSGYYTGFSREVSYTMFFIVVGLGIYIFGNGSLKLKSKNERKRIGDIIAVVFLLGALFLSGKRATLLFFILATLATQFLRSKDRLKLLKYLLGTICGITLLWATSSLWLQIPALSRIVELVRFIETRDFIGITNGRITIYESALKLWRNNKWIGIGWGNFKYSVFQSAWYAGFDVHNCYLQILCETGILGAAIFYTLTIVSIIKAILAAVRFQKRDLELHNLAVLSAFIQFFFLFYCVTEPVLYEYTDYILYFICVNISGIILKSLKRHSINNIKGDKSSEEVNG